MNKLLVLLGVSVLAACSGGSGFSLPNSATHTLTDTLSSLAVAGRSRSIDAGTGSQGLPPQVWTSLVATPLASPQPVLGADGRVHLVYELIVMNASSSVITLDRLETLDASEGDAVINTESGSALVATLEGRGLDSVNPPFPGQIPRTIGPFQWTRLFLDATFAGFTTLPKVLEHRFQIELTPAAGDPTVALATAVSGRTEVTDDRAVVIGPPLEGPRWVDAIGCCSPPSVHRTATLPINGKIVASERFAIDFVQLNAENKLYAGPQNKLSSYAYEGAKVLSVADGTVVGIQDGQPEQTPSTFPKGLTVLQNLGNFVVVDIGHSRFAFYAHFQPNTLRAKVGERVRRGQVLALLGNSGNTDAPHLHFGILDGRGPFSSNSLPFVFSSFTVAGTITNSFDEDIQNAGAPAEIGPAQAGPHYDELPLQDEVIAFPKQ